MTALKDALDALRPFAEVSLLAAYQSLPEGQYFDLYFADGDEACFNAFTVADLRRVAAVYAAIKKMMDAPPPPAGDMVLVPREALDWLFGQGPDAQGYWFGDYEDNSSALNEKRPAFWWRSKFRAMLAAAPLPAQERNRTPC